MNIDLEAAKTLFQLGLAGIGLWWFATRFEKRFERFGDTMTVKFEKSFEVMDDLSRSICLMLLCNDNLSHEAKAQTNKILTSVERRHEERVKSHEQQSKTLIHN